MREIKCEDCPLSWEERGLEDCDCGCYIYGDLYDGGKLVCHFPESIKRFMAKRAQARMDKQQAHQWDGLFDYYAEQDRKDRAFKQAIEECILNNHYGEKVFLCTEDKDGKRYKYNDGKPTSDDIGLARIRYEDLLKESEE